MTRVTNEPRQGRLVKGVQINKSASVGVDE